MNIRETQQKIESSIADSLDSVESLHRLSANTIFEQVAEIAPISAMVQNLRPFYENGAAQVFEAGRSLNRTAGDLTRTLLDRMGM